MNKYDLAVLEVAKKLLGENINENEIILFTEIRNDDDLKMFLACVDKYGVEKNKERYMRDLFVYEEDGEYCFIENDGDCDIDDDKIIGEMWYSLGEDFYSGDYIVQFERV